MSPLKSSRAKRSVRKGATEAARCRTTLSSPSASQVKFKDLGLVIIDEEHRFGVKHKESLKQMRKIVDVITMTATPIPRTLQMTITGIPSLLHRMNDLGIGFKDLNTRQSSLEDIFVSLVSERA